MGRRRLPTALIACILIATVGQGMVLPFLLIYLTRVRHLHAGWAGFVGAWIGIAGLLLAPAVGSAVDRHGPRRVFVAVMAVYGAGVAGYALVHAAWQAVLVASLAAFGGAPLLGAYNTLLASVTPPESQQWVFSFAFSTLNLGFGVGGIIGGAVADIHRPATFEVLYAAAGAALLLSAVPVLAMRGVPDASGQPTETMPVKVGYRRVLRDRVFRRVLIVGVLLTSVGYAQLEFGFPLFAVDELHVGTRTVGWAFAANSTTIVVAQMIVFARIAGRSRSRLLALTGVTIAASWTVLASGTMATAGSTTAVAAATASTVIFALGELMFSPIMPALANVLAPEELRGRYNALSSMVFGVTAIVGPLSAAPLIANGHGGVWATLVIAGALAAALAAASLRTRLTPAQDGREALAA